MAPSTATRPRPLASVAWHHPTILLFALLCRHFLPLYLPENLSMFCLKGDRTNILSGIMSAHLIRVRCLLNHVDLQPFTPEYVCRSPGSLCGPTHLMNACHCATAAMASPAMLTPARHRWLLYGLARPVWSRAVRVNWLLRILPLLSRQDFRPCIGFMLFVPHSELTHWFFFWN